MLNYTIHENVINNFIEYPLDIVRQLTKHPAYNIFIYYVQTHYRIHYGYSIAAINLLCVCILNVYIFHIFVTDIRQKNRLLYHYRSLFVFFFFH